MLEKIENELITELTQHFPDYDVDSFPVDFKNYSFTAPKGCILIRYDASNFNDQKTVWAVNQEETFEFSIITGLRYLYKFSDSYSFLSELKNILQGMEIEGKRFVLKKREFIDEINGDLWWGMTLRITFQSNDLHNQKGEIYGLSI